MIKLQLIKKSVWTYLIFFKNELLNLIHLNIGFKILNTTISSTFLQFKSLVILNSINV